MSDEDIRSDEESELPRMSPSFASKASQRRKGVGNSYETPSKSRASTTATPELRHSNRSSPHPVFSLPSGPRTRPTSPLYVRSEEKRHTGGDLLVGKQQFSQRFLKLQSDLRRQGYSTGLEDAETSYLPQSLHRSPSPPRRAIRLEADEDTLAVLRPQLHWCPYCRREVTTVLQPRPCRKT